MALPFPIVQCNRSNKPNGYIEQWGYDTNVGTGANSWTHNFAVQYTQKPYLILNRTWSDVNTTVVAGDMGITTQNTLDTTHFIARGHNSPAYYYAKGY